MIRGGVTTQDELDDPDGPLDTSQFSGFAPATPEEVVAFIRADDTYERPATVEPRFRIGDAVIVKNNHPDGHTRCPRYTRGRRGVVQLHHGVHGYQDDEPEDAGEQHLYTVVFTGKELWGDRGHENDRISAELWEVHLLPVSE